VSLTPGKHTLQLILGDKDHIPHNPPAMSKRITAGRHANMQTLLRAMLEETTPAVKAFFQASGDGNELPFWLREALFIAPPA
jgi:hypothetical protein